jgi:hypothetical protein
VIHRLGLSPDGRVLFTNAARGTKQIGWFQLANDVWDARTGQHLHRLEQLRIEYPPAAFSPDGRVMYLGGRGFDSAAADRSRADALTAWDPAAGKLLRRFDEPDRPAGRDDRVRERFGRRSDPLAVSPDGRLLAVAEGPLSSSDVWVYETATGRVVRTFSGHTRWVNDLTFTPDGRRLVSVGHDQTGLVWDVTPAGLAVGRPAVKGTAEAWDRLAAADPATAYAGIAALAVAPAEGVALLREKLRPAPVPTAADLDRVVEQLDAAAFADRERAAAELDRYGPHAVAGVKVRLANAASAEVRARLARFLDVHDGPHPSPYRLQCARGVAALEAIATADARAVLVELARGPADDPLTREAAAAVGRRPSRP